MANVLPPLPLKNLDTLDALNRDSISLLEREREGDRERERELEKEGEGES